MCIIVLVIFFNALLPITNRMKLTHTGEVTLKIEKKEIVMIVLLTVVSALAVAAYYLYNGLK